MFDIEPRGEGIGKLSLDLMDSEAKGKLILVTSINPTPAGEGKTTLNIGLSMALNKLGVSAVSCLREPSMGPNFGMKGAATGGGACTVEPSEVINLHFTGDFHAITSAHNLLAAFVDNHIFHGNVLNVEEVLWHRVVDMNDRALRRIVLMNGRKSRFDITVTSEIMAILCLSESYDELRERISKINVAYDTDGNVLTPQDFGAVNSMMVLLKDALRPNIVKTIEGTPAIIHGGPFANIAHGCNSVIATKTGLAHYDYVITEAGFGADLGAEKFFDIKCRQANLNPYAVVMVISVRALKIHGGVALKDLDTPDLDAVKQGWKHAQKHIENLQGFNQKVVLALNHFDSDGEDELDYLKSMGCIQTRSFQEGGKGVLDLAQAIIDCEHETPQLKFAYEQELNIKDKILKIAQSIYGADGVTYAAGVDEFLESYSDQSLEICVAKTQYSFSDDPKKLGIPTGFDVHVSDVRVSAGAGFVVVYMGRVLTMPGLPKVPREIEQV